MGSTEVPVDPQRVVTLDSPHLDAALSLGLTPVGSVQSAVAQGLPAYLGTRTEGIEVVGTIEEPNLEAIAALDPDLILSATVRHEQLYDQLSRIAPTVFTASSGTDWREGFDLVAEALNRSEEGDTALAEHDERVEAVGRRIGAEGTSASIVRFLPEETRVYGPGTFSGSVLSEVGLDLPDLDYDEYSMAYISPEQVQLVDADAIFSATYGDPSATTRGAVSVLWQRLPAVQEGCQFDIEDDEWMIGIGLIGAGIILDDLENALGDSSCA
ncbi:ABC transporter substrate-binding protein [Kineococcus arenarius]|uniref:ABC transporter substrate-binding protein n=1 Tax=unclassified Kineococcus TaxID=2621656 RepID=UPI003D7E885B